MLHGEGAGNFFEDFRSWFKSQNKITVDNRDWSEYLLYASDYPYFGDVHAQKLLKYVINKRFFDSGGTLNDVRNILGLNQIKVLPEYNLPQVRKDGPELPSTIISNVQNGNIDSFEIAIKVLAKLIVENKIDIKRFCIQFKKTWTEFNDDVLLNTIKRTTNEEVLIMFTKLIKDRIALIAPLTTQIPWNKFGYKYFSPRDRQFFSLIFRQNYLTVEEKQVIDCLTQIFP
jgi:hypothetical protein